LVFRRIAQTPRRPSKSQQKAHGHTACFANVTFLKETYKLFSGKSEKKKALQLFFQTYFTVYRYCFSR
jgi:hypothetical protein